MDNYINLDVRARRMLCRATGTWDYERACIFREQMICVTDAMTLDGGPFTVLTDLTGLATHAQSIAPIIGEGASQLLRVRLERYAMIVPMALMRMQVRRIHAGVNMRFFDDRTIAMLWLDWDVRALAALQSPAAMTWHNDGFIGPDVPWDVAEMNVRSSAA